MSEIVRVKHAGFWTDISHNTLRDPRLSLEALGLLCRLLSRPNNWQVRLGSLRRELGIGQDKMRKLLAELSREGYLHREKRHGAGGRWEWESTLWSESQKPLTLTTGAFPVDGQANIGPAIDGADPYIIRNNHKARNNDREKDNDKEIMLSVTSHVTPGTTNPESEVLSASTREGRVCKQLRELGVRAAPHMVIVKEMCACHSDEHILAAAEIALEMKGVGIHVGYIAAMLKDPGNHSEKNSEHKQPGQPPSLEQSNHIRL